MPSQFDRLSDAEGHRQVGTTVERAAGRLGRGRSGGGRMVFVATAALTALGVVALAAPSALAGGGSGGDTTVAAAPTSTPTDGAAKKVPAKKGAAAKSASPSATTDDVDGDSVPAPTPSPTAKKKSSTVTQTSAKTPIPATESKYARNVPAYPPDGRKGRRIVYSKALMTVWIVDSKDKVVRRYPVTGRWDRPAKGTYKIYSKSASSSNEHSMVTFEHMVRFAWGTNDKTAAIGFHSIPIYYKDNPERGAKKGDRMTTKNELGLPVASGGCIRQADEDAEFLYRWSEVGDTVVVLPTAD